MRLHYLDDFREQGSLSILSQLGVEFSSNLSLDCDFPLSGEIQNVEGIYVGVVSYHVKLGELIVDIRDSADCWIRCYLSENDTLAVPAKLSHRVLSGSAFPGNSNTITSVATNDLSNNLFTKRFSNDKDAIQLTPYHNYRELVCELCQQFFKNGWVTGTGGSISIRYGNRIYMTPSGVQKERILPDELFVLDIKGNKLRIPDRKPGTAKGPVLSDCAALFLHAFQQRNAGLYQAIFICLYFKYVLFYRCCVT